jgi:RNA polymerase sigma factor (sigma-70 family)
LKALTVDQLVRNHDRLACKRAHVLHRRLPAHSIELDDLLQVARMGLTEAALRWERENDSHASFATFAYYRVQGALIDHVREVIGRDGQRLATVNARSLDAVLPGTADRSRLDACEDVSAMQAMDDVESYDCIQAAGFDEREAVIARGMIDDVPLKTLAAQLGLSQSRISQLVARMEPKMRAQGMVPRHMLAAA